MAYQELNVQPGDLILSSDINAMSAQIGLNEEDIAQLNEDIRKIEIQYTGGNVFTYNGQTLNYKQIHDYLIVSPNFVYIMYENNVHLCSYFNDTSTPKEMRFSSSIVDNGITKRQSINITSNNGTSISNVNVVNISNENISNKVESITEQNKDSIDQYPSVKASYDFTSSISSKLSADIFDNKKKIDALWKISEGQTYDIEEQEEFGMNDSPSGSSYISLIDVRGNSTQISTKGYQLLPDDSFPQTGTDLSVQKIGENYQYKLSTLTSGTYRQVNKDTVTSIPVGTYTVHSDVEGVGYLILRLYDNENPSSGSLVTNAINVDSTHKTVTFTTTDITKCIRVIFVGNKNSDVPVGTETILSNIMLESGSVAHDWEHYSAGISSPSPVYPQEIHTVEEFTIKAESKNLLPITALIGSQTLSGITYANTGNGGITFSGTATAQSMPRGNNFTLQPGTYTFSGGYYGQLRLMPIGTTIIAYRSKQTFTLYEETELQFRFQIPSGTEVSETTVYPQIERGSVATPYTKYVEPLIRTITPPSPLNNIGDFMDTCDINSGMWKYAITVVALDATKWNTYASEVYYKSYSNYDAYIDTKYTPKCNKLACASMRGAAEIAQLPYNTGTLNSGSSNTRFIVHYNGTINEFTSAIGSGIEIMHKSLNDTYMPINADDLEFLRSISTLSADGHIIITDQDNKDVPWLAEYIIKLSEVI